MAIPRWFKAILSHYGVPFEEHHHPPVFSASYLAQQGVGRYASGAERGQAGVAVALGQPPAVRPDHQGNVHEPGRRQAQDLIQP